MPKSADAFRTISEVADWLGVQTHVLRFWESKFTQIKPVKRAGGRRYYRPTDMLLLGGIRKLLHDDGLTIKGVQKILREEGMAHVADMSKALDEETTAQIDGDLVKESGFVEAELAPASSDEDTVTPFPTAAEPAPEPTLPPAVAHPDPVDVAVPTAPLSYDLADQTPAVAPEPPAAPPAEDTAPVAAAAAEAEAEPAPIDTPEPASEPAAATTTEPEAIAETPSESMASAPGSVAEPAPEPEPASAEAPSEPGIEPTSAPESPSTEDIAASEPAFVHAAPEAVPTPPEVTDSPAASALPSFLTQKAPDTPTADVPEDAVEAAKPKPRIVDVPEEPDPETLDVAPSALSKSARITHLTADQRSALRPLLAQLTALRDQMAGPRQDPR